MNFAELASIVGLAVGIVTLITIAVRVGLTAGRIAKTQETLTADIEVLNKKLVALDEIHTLVLRVAAVEERAIRNTSDIRELREHAAYARGEKTGRVRALSRPDIGERGPDED